MANFIRSTSRMEEREAPDGEEEESPRSIPSTQDNHADRTPEDLIRVPSWIDNPSVARLTVLFKDRALAQLTQMGSEVSILNHIIISIINSLK